MTRKTRKRVVGISSLAIAAAVVAFLYWPKPVVDDLDAGSIEPKLDEEYRRLVVGIWQDDYKGKRTLTIRSDGTATMVVEPDGVNAIFASRLTFEEKWSIEGGRLKQTAIGGEPKTRVNLILKTMGDETVQKILELTEQRLLLLDPDGRTKYDWRRID